MGAVDEIRKEDRFRLPLEEVYVAGERAVTFIPPGFVWTGVRGLDDNSLLFLRICPSTPHYDMIPAMNRTLLKLMCNRAVERPEGKAQLSKIGEDGWHMRYMTHQCQCDDCITESVLDAISS